MLKSQDFLLKEDLSLARLVLCFCLFAAAVVFKIRWWKQEDLESEAIQGYMKVYGKQQEDGKVGDAFRHT